MEIDNAYLGGGRSGVKTDGDSEKETPVVLAVETIGLSAEPDVVCIAQSSFRREAIAEFIAQRRVRPLALCATASTASP